jgi:hypothetical protein
MSADDGREIEERARALEVAQRLGAKALEVTLIQRRYLDWDAGEESAKKGG